MQYTNKLFEFYNGYQNVECLEILTDRLLDTEQEYSLNYIIMKALESKKTLRFRVGRENVGEL
jgi:hypothetical protein